MPRKRAAPGDKAVLPPRTPADLVSIMSGNRAIRNSFVSYLGHRDIARLRLVSKALSKLFPVTHFLEHVVGTKRLAALSPLPILEQPLIRTDSTITEGGRYMSTGNFPRVPSRILTPYSHTHEYEAMIKEVPLKLWERYRHYTQHIKSILVVYPDVRERMYRGDFFWARRDRFALTVLKSPLPLFANIRSITWVAEDNPSTLDVLLKMLTQQVQELNLTCDISTDSSSCVGFFRSFSERSPNLVTLRLNSESRLEGFDSVLVDAIPSLKKLRHIGLSSPVMPSRTLQRLSNSETLRDICLTCSDQCTEENVDEEGVFGNFSALTNVALVSTSGCTLDLFGTCSFSKKLKNLDITFLDAANLSMETLHSVCQRVESFFPKLENFSLHMGQSSPHTEHVYYLDATMLEPLSQCSKLQSLVVNCSSALLEVDIKEELLLKMLQNWPLLKRLEITSSLSSLSMGSLVAVTRLCPRLQELSLPFLPHMDGMNVLEGQDLQIPSHQDQWRANALQKLHLQFSGYPIVSPLEMATYLNRICPASCIISGSDHSEYKDSPDFTPVTARILAFREYSKRVDPAIEDMQRQIKKLKKENLALTRVNARKTITDDSPSQRGPNTRSRTRLS